MKKMRDYKYHYTVKGKIYFSFEQKEKVASFFGAARFVYNRLFAIDKEVYRLKESSAHVPVYAERIEYLESIKSSARQFKNSAPFLWDIPDEVVANAIKNYKNAWACMHEQNQGLPVFKKKGCKESFQINPHYYRGSVQMNDCKGFYFVDVHHVHLPKIGVVRIQCSDTILRPILESNKASRIGTVTIRKDAVGEYFICVLFGSDGSFIEPYPTSNKVCGIDLNLDNYLTLNDGTVVENPRHLRKAEEKLKTEQRKLSRKAKRAKAESRTLSGSSNYQKQKEKVAKLYRKVSRQRKEFHLTLAKDLIKNHDKIYAEKLNINKLMQDTFWAKSIADAGWQSFLSILQVKAVMTGRMVILVDPAYTSQTCSACGYRLNDTEKLSLSDRTWICPNCGALHTRDQNAAENILKRGLLIT